MDDMEKSYLEIKVTFQHILILLAGVILIGSFLFYLGYQAGKSPAKDKLSTDGGTQSIDITDTGDPDKIEQTQTGEPSISEEINLHRQPDAAKPVKKEETKPSKPLRRGTFFAIQVGAFSSHSSAKNYSLKFSKMGYPTSISQTESRGKTLYRVRVGSYKTRVKARQEKAKLEKTEKGKFAVVKSD